MIDSSTLKSKTVPEIMSDYIKEAVELRYSAIKVDENADMSVLLKALQDYRARLDRIEYLLVRAVIRKGDALRAFKQAQNEATDVWDKRLSEIKDKKTVSLVAMQEFTAPREKYATANLASVEERQASRQAEEVLSWTEETVDALQKMYRGLDSSRQDILTRIKSIPMVNSMEYTTS